MFAAAPANNDKMNGSDLETNRAIEKPENRQTPGMIEKSEAFVDRSEKLMKSRKSLLRNKKAKKKADPAAFLAVNLQPARLTLLLECIYTASLIRDRNGSLERVIMTDASDAAFLEATGIFDRVISVSKDADLRREIKAVKPGVIFCPDSTLREDLALLFSRIPVRISGRKSRLLTALWKNYETSDKAHLGKLKDKGIDLFPELLGLHFRGKFQGEKAAPEGDYIWISLDDQHDLTGSWPAGHAGRLVRLIEDAGMKAVISLGHSSENRERKLTEFAYLQKAVPSALLLFDETILNTASLMQGALAVIGPAGPETILASFLRRPALILHDMLSFRHHPETSGLSFLDRARMLELPEVLSANGRQGKGLSLYVKLADTFERHMKPSVDECIENCSGCAFQSCVEFISPERVFENLKRVIFPC